MGKYYLRVIEERLYEVEAETPGEAKSMYDGFFLSSEAVLVEHEDTLISIEQNDPIEGVVTHYLDPEYAKKNAPAGPYTQSGFNAYAPGDESLGFYGPVGTPAPGATEVQDPS